jgi:hypothetical protein
MTSMAAVAPERQSKPGWRRAVVPALVGLIVVYGAALRFDALTLQFGPVKRPAWLHTLQASPVGTSVPRPAGLMWSLVPTAPHRDGVWTRYTSDPYTYVQYARQMRHFYAAHRREPVFPFVTRVFLGLLRDQDVAVSFAAASFSVLAILATFLLGSCAFSPWVGVGAAAAMAIEYDAISWGVRGWRDDAFTCAVVLSAYTIVRYMRVPSRRNAVLLGVVGGISCLIRITSVSFLAPGFACLLLASRQPWKERLAGIALAAVTAAVIVAPFLIDCWRVFGDPFYAINVHADVYRAAEGQAVDVTQTAARYLGNQARSRPMRTLDTVALGMTSYPFLNKWGGFDPWLRGLGGWLSVAALSGLLLFLASPHGRVLLLVLAASLVPYAATWRLAADWRFTEHAYPFFLIAASLAIAQLVRASAAPSRLVSLARRRPSGKTTVAWASVLTVLAIATWFVTRMLPVLVADETLRANEAMTIVAGGRDGGFFTAGWSAPTGAGLAVRASRGPRSIVRIPVPRLRDYELTLRLDPFPRPLADTIADMPQIQVSFNDQPVTILHLVWNPQRFGSYNVHIPKSMMQPGLNRLILTARPSSGKAAGFTLWYVRIQPPTS